jgi:hypothetical protein
MSNHEIPLKDYLNSINLKQGDLTEDERAMAKYPAFVINKCMGGFIDTVMNANAMNGMAHIDKNLQYQFYLYSVRKSKRFSPWQKKESNKDIDLVKQYYGYNYEKAEQVLRILTKEQLSIIKSKLDIGGKR